MIEATADQNTATSKRFSLSVDPWMAVITGVMIIFGLVMVYSASWDVSWRLYGDPNALFNRQVGNLLIGFIAMLSAFFFPLDWLRRLALPLITFTILILFAVLVVNLGGEYKRSFLGASVQPSELAKLALVIYLAVWMESKGDRLSTLGYGFVPLIAIVGVVGGLIVAQPDLSAGLTIGLVALTLFFLAGASGLQTLGLSVGGSLVGYMVIRLHQTGAERWLQFRDGLVDIEKAHYHVQQSLQAFYSGGILGRGLGASRSKFGLLPAPHTDSVYAVIGEELGLIGALLILALFAVFLWRGFKIAVGTRDRLAMLLASGVTFWIGAEALINMSVLLGLLPFAGNALPFFSYGGSSLVTSMTGIGFILNVSRMTRLETRKRGYVATFSSSRRDGGRRLSRLGRARRTRREQRER
ncbi:MAG: cell division protein FtsW [Anaerolineales bacterium]|nr:MAG: cell division protein FtsW [Anaerolineales bacterium]